MINCSLGDDGVPSYGDTCSYTCNTGYELTGSDTRSCQSDRSWSGSEVMYSRAVMSLSNDINFVKPGAHRPQAGARLVSWNCFCADVCMRVCVCLPPRLLITSGVMWRDMDLMRLVKQVLQLLYGNCSRYC